MFRQGRFQEAVEHYTTALEMGAGSNQAAAHAYILGAQYLAGRYEAAVRAGEIAAVESAGTGAYAHLPVLIIKAKAEYFNGDPGRAAETIEQAWSSYGKDYPASFAGPLALLGETERAKELLGTGEARWAANEGCWAVEYFWGHYHLGDVHRAFVWMVRAIENREDHMIAAMHGSPLLDPIRDDPRFLAAMERLDEVEAIGTPITSVAYP